MKQYKIIKHLPNLAKIRLKHCNFLQNGNNLFDFFLYKDNGFRTSWKINSVFFKKTVIYTYGGHMVKNNNVYNKEYKSKLKVEVLEVQTNSKLNQGEVIKVGVLKKEKISGMPAWFKEWSETVYQNVQPKWFISWSTEFEKRTNARFERIETKLETIIRLNNLKTE